MVSENFEQVLLAAQADGSLTPAWKKFVNTRFFVPVTHASHNDPGNNAENVALYTDVSTGMPSVTISEVRERLLPQQGDALVAMFGAELVRRLHGDAGILVALSEHVFSIAGDRVGWLRKGIAASQARAAEKKARAAPGVPAAPAPALTAPLAPLSPAPISPAAILPAPLSPAPLPPAPLSPAPISPAPLSLAPISPAPLPPVKRNQVGVLDIAALKPRAVTVPRIGLGFFVPGHWTESATTTGLRFTDTERQTTVEASGFHRPNLSMTQWMEMRLALVQHEMRYLTQDGDSYPFDGEHWRGRVKAMATEFTGTFPGEDVPSRYLVACIWTDGVLASITIRATADAFEQLRPLFKWLLGRVEMSQAAAAIYSAPASLKNDLDRGDWAVDDTAPMFGMSLAGRMGRARALAYTMPMMVLAGLVGIMAAVLLPMNKLLGGIVALAAVGALAWFCLRLMVLRMHDVNLSGKWLLGAMAVLGVAGATQNLVFLVTASIAFWIASLVIYCVIPGTKGENDYGEAPGPNSLLIKIGAGLFIIVQLGQIAAVGSGRYNDRLRMPGARGASLSPAAAPALFTAPDGSCSVMLPGVPEEIELPPAVRANLGGIEQRHYQLVAQNNVYTVQAINYVDDAPDNRFDAMDATQDDIIGDDGTLIEARPILLKGATGREVKVALAGGGVRAARFALVDRKFCMASVLAPDAAKAGPAIDAFLASFTLQ